LQHIDSDAALPLSMQVTTPTAHTMGTLLAVSPDTAKFLAVVLLRQTILRLRDSQHYELSLYELYP
jgi:hypothetical protein